MLLPRNEHMCIGLRAQASGFGVNIKQWLIFLKDK